MSIQSSSVLVDGTIAASAGTATSLLTRGRNLDTVETILDDGSEFLNTSFIGFSTKSPKVSVNAPNGYTQVRNTVKVSVPLVLDNGNNTVNTVSVVLAVDVETTDTEVQSLLVTTAQLLTDSDFSDFWKKQSLA